MRNRMKIDLSDSLVDVAIKMAENNPGALSVCMKIMESKNPLAMLSLDDMNIRGPQIWVAYKDHCGEDFDKFMAAIDARDSGMVETVNRNSGINEVAVTHGASFSR